MLFEPHLAGLSIGRKGGRQYKSKVTEGRLKCIEGHWRKNDVLRNGPRKNRV
jgi:hypothetical protein